MIPSVFEERIRAELGAEAEDFLASLQQEAVRGIRMNPRYGIPPEQVGAGQSVPWFPDMYELSAASDAGKLALHEAGAYYLQDPSAAAPAAAVSPRAGERILDLCAAPGGKATAMALAAPDALVVANEIVPDRARVLSANVERLGCRNVVVVNESPARLAEKWPGMFDAVLVDAPCSGEGMFRKHPETADEWQPDTPEACARRQAGILDCAAQLVAPGGRLCYSTCTFNRAENEDQAAAFSERHQAFEICDFALPGIGASRNGCLRLWPHKVHGEGHFVAMFRRREGNRDSVRTENNGGLPAPGKDVRTEAVRFLRSLMEEPFRPDAAFAGGIWQVPELVPDLAGLRVLRPGLRLLQCRGQLLLPDHALSHAGTAQQRISLTEDQTARYLHGETLAVPDSLQGWIQVCIVDVPLGWGKATQGVLKNHYPKGLRK